MVERLVDVAARELGLDPVEHRRKNFIPAAEFPNQTLVALQSDSGHACGGGSRGLGDVRRDPVGALS